MSLPSLLLFNGLAADLSHFNIKRQFRYSHKYVIVFIILFEEICALSRNNILINNSTKYLL